MVTQQTSHLLCSHLSLCVCVSVCPSLSSPTHSPASLGCVLPCLWVDVVISSCCAEYICGSGDQWGLTWPWLSSQSEVISEWKVGGRTGCVIKETCWWETNSCCSDTRPHFASWSCLCCCSAPCCCSLSQVSLFLQVWLFPVQTKGCFNFKSLCVSNSDCFKMMTLNLFKP